MSAFVGVKTVESAENLKTLIDNVIKGDRCYFLRWPHKVSGLSRKLPDDFPSPEGQAFTCDRELRWKVQGQRYSTLLLSNSDKVDGFDAIGDEWETCDRSAQVYPPTETRFPHGIADRGINIEQRYFRDKKTATVHFVALVVK
jgi:hypothetical protein